VRDWWRRLFPSKSVSSGAPGTGRQKTYSAESGYVYQYVLASFGHHQRGGEEVFEYSFRVSSGRGPAIDLAVLLKSSVLCQWTRQHDREFSASERYGIAKIALKRQLDTSDDPASLPASISPDQAQVSEISDYLGL
jgi:hypothetical protein